MQDVSRATGDPVSIHSVVKGRDFILRGMCFDDLAVLQRTFLHEKRKRIMQAAQLRAEIEPPESRAAILDKAQNDAVNAAYLSDEEFNATLQTAAGMVEFLWALFARQYPGVVSRDDIVKMAAAKEFPAESMQQLMWELIGGGPAGNSTGQSNGAV